MFYILPYLNNQNVNEDIDESQTTPLFYINKIVCYSSAYGINNASSQASWNLNLSQFTDIAIYINSSLEVSKIYVDSISFTNNNTGTLSLNYLPYINFAKSPIEENIDNSNKTTNNVNNISQGEILSAPEKIDLELTSPITLRYLNKNLKENCIISDINEPLSFDGSILKRGKITISSIKNNISFNLHVIDNASKEFTYKIKIPINLENKESGKSIYNGSYYEEILYNFSN